MSYAKEQVEQKLQEVKQQAQNNPNGIDDIQAELGMDFVTYMMHSGKMSIEEVVVHAMDLLTAGVDSVSHNSMHMQLETLSMLISTDQHDHDQLCLPSGH